MGLFEKIVRSFTSPKSIKTLTDAIEEGSGASSFDELSGSPHDNALLGNELDGLQTQIDTLVSGVVYANVRLAKGTNQNLSSAPASIDGVNLAANDRVLLFGQTALAENGIYVYASTGAALTRATDANAWAEFLGLVVNVTAGDTLSGKQYRSLVGAGGTLETDDILFSLATSNDIHAATAKTTLVNADEFGIWDSVAAAFKKITWANIKQMILLFLLGLQGKVIYVSFYATSGDGSAGSPYAGWEGALPNDGSLDRTKVWWAKGKHFTFANTLEFDQSTKNVELTGGGHLHFTGSGPMIRFDNAGPGGPVEEWGAGHHIHDLILDGGANGTRAIYMQGTHHCIVENIDFTNVQAGVECYFCVCGSYRNIRHTQDLYGTDIQHPAKGVILGWACNSCTVIDCVIEECTVCAIELNQANNVTIIGGSFENGNQLGSGDGIHVIACHNTTIKNQDDELNIYDIIFDANCSFATVEGMDAQSGVTFNGGEGHKVVDSKLGTLTIDANCVGLILDNVKITSSLSDNSTSTVYRGRKSVTVTIPDPTASEDQDIFFTDRPVTIVKARAVCVGGTSPSLTINPVHGTNRSTAGTNLLSSPAAITNTSGGAAITSFANASVAAGSYFRLKTTAVSGSPAGFVFTIWYD